MTDELIIEITTDVAYALWNGHRRRATRAELIREILRLRQQSGEAQAAHAPPLAVT